MGVRELAIAIKVAVDNRIREEAEAMRGTIQDGKFQSGAKSYPYVAAVDCNTSEGNRVYAQKAQDGKVIIVGD